jgi:CRISPR-associated endonuclease/helicase Cas3
MAKEKLVTKLEPRSISACASLPNELAFMKNALQHQVDVFEQSRNADIVLDLSPTGTGKTQAALAVLKHNPTQSAVYIAPTNALVEQQREAAEKFVREAGLRHVVKAASAREVREWPNDKVGKRSGEKLYNVLRNPATVFSDVGADRPIILVTNPDIFYYATFFAYNKNDRTNIASAFYQKFGTVIFDEFHLYDAKQLVSLLFYLAYSYVFGFFQYGRRVVLLTATPEPACKLALKNLEFKGVRIAWINEETSNSHLLPSQTAVNLELRAQPERDQLLLELAQKELNKLTAFPNCRIERKIGDAIAPTPLLKVLEKHLLPGVIVCGVKNAAAIFQLRTQGIVSYPIVIACDDAQKDHYRFLPGLAGILTMAMKSKQLRLPDNEPFII